MKYYSQCKQDELLYARYFHKLTTPGFFIEIGAHNGEYLSNTLFYEESLNWQGICIEASPLLFAECEKRRKCLALNYAICNNDGEAEEENDDGNDDVGFNKDQNEELKKYYDIK
jgi:hypothetical protein